MRYFYKSGTRSCLPKRASLLAPSWLRLAGCLFAGLVTTTAQAWDAHYLLTYQALKATPLPVAEVKTETLQSFVQQEKNGLAVLLRQSEQWCQQHVLEYPRLPEEKQFPQKSADLPLAKQFIQAIRANPELSYSLFVLQQPGRQVAKGQPLKREQILYPTLEQSPFIRIPVGDLKRIQPGDSVPALDVLASASDEPDYGMDVNLWQDSQSGGYGYGLGPQPFGKGVDIISSQGPFHLGFYFESPIMVALAPVIKQCYPEYRIHLYSQLARYAFASGHLYWGLRFLGWALHYLQDLTQPYHTRVAPNTSTAKMLLYETLAIAKLPRHKNDLIKVVSNRHYSLENYEYFAIAQQLSADSPCAFVKALQGRDGKSLAGNSKDYPRQVVAKQANQGADSIDTALATELPQRYVGDASYSIYEHDPELNLFEMTRKQGIATNKLDAHLIKLLQHVGEHTRVFIRETLRQ